MLSTGKTRSRNQPIRAIDLINRGRNYLHIQFTLTFLRGYLTEDSLLLTEENRKLTGTIPPPSPHPTENVGKD